MSRFHNALLSLAVPAALTCGWVYAQNTVARPGPGGVYIATPNPASFGLFPGQADPRNEASQFAQRYVKAEKEEDKRDLRKKMDDVLSKQFDQHMQQQTNELKELEKQIDQLKATLRKRQEAKETIVRRRAEQLINEAEGLGWTAPSSPRGGSSGFTGIAPMGGAFGGRGSGLPPGEVPVSPTPAPGKLESR